MSHKTLMILTVLLLTIIVAGCTPPQAKPPLTVCAGQKSQAASTQKLNEQTAMAQSFKALGQCRLDYVADGKKGKENFPVKLWVNPPEQILFLGDVAFNPSGINVGSNDQEFWFAAKPKEIGNAYYWGKWSEQTESSRLLIDPRTLLEALGYVQVNDSSNWSLSNDGAFDILTLKNLQGYTVKKVYVSACDYAVRKIEYFDADGDIFATTELDYGGRTDFPSIPSVIKLTTIKDPDNRYVFKIALRSVESYDFTEERQSRFFDRRKPKGYKDIIRIIDGTGYKQADPGEME